MSSSLTLTPFHKVIEDYRNGKMVIIVDDPDRENEGDLAFASELVTPEHIAFMMDKARGLICVSISSETARNLKLPLQVLNNNSPYQTAFTVSVDSVACGENAVTAEGRAKTIAKMLKDDATPADFTIPGHIYPLISNANGVVGRRGQTEASSDLARIAGLKASGVICEILNPDGTMARGGQVADYAKRYNLSVTSVEAIVRYRQEQEVFVREVASHEVQTRWGHARVFVFSDEVASKEHLAIVFGDVRGAQAPLVRIHSECLTGDVLGSRRCDCGAQLNKALEAMANEGCGVMLYMRQEGRGIGLMNKIRAYELQDQGADTVDANLKLGFEADERDYAAASNILSGLGIQRLRLITNNPRKIKGLENGGLVVSERVSAFVDPDKYSEGYLDTKRTRLGHLM